MAKTWFALPFCESAFGATGDLPKIPLHEEGLKAKAFFEISYLWFVFALPERFSGSLCD
jgi:hypothetical protein